MLYVECFYRIKDTRSFSLFCTPIVNAIFNWIAKCFEVTLNEINSQFDSVCLVGINSWIDKKMISAFFPRLVFFFQFCSSPVRKWQFAAWVWLLIHPIFKGSTPEFWLECTSSRCHSKLWFHLSKIMCCKWWMNEPWGLGASKSGKMKEIEYLNSSGCRCAMRTSIAYIVVHA